MVCRGCSRGGGYVHTRTLLGRLGTAREVVPEMNCPSMSLPKYSPPRISDNIAHPTHARLTVPSSPVVENHSISPHDHPDPYKLMRFVDQHRLNFSHEIKRLEDPSCALWARDVFWMFPQAPFMRQKFLPYLAASTRTEQENYSHGGAQWVLRDFPPNDLRGEDACRAYLRLPPVRFASHNQSNEVTYVDLRQNYKRAVRALLLRMQRFTEQEKQRASRLHSCYSALGMLGGPRTFPIIYSSLLLFANVSTPGVFIDGKDVPEYTTRTTFVKSYPLRRSTYQSTLNKVESQAQEENLMKGTDTSNSKTSNISTDPFKHDDPELHRLCVTLLLEIEAKHKCASDMM